MIPGQQFQGKVSNPGFQSQIPQGHQMAMQGTAGQEGVQKGIVLADQQQQQPGFQQPGMLSPAQNPFFKTRICKLWRVGTCPNGDNCGYAHGELELRQPNMELLRLQEGNPAPNPNPMPYPNPVGQTPQLGPPGRPPFMQQSHTNINAVSQQPSHFGHRPQANPPFGYSGSFGGLNDMSEEERDRFRGIMYKTKMCPAWVQRGWCNYKDRCSFAHSRQELRPFVPLHDGTWTGMPRGDLGVPQYRDRGHFAGQARPTTSLPETLDESFIPKQVTYLEKVRGLCGVIGLGNATDYANKNPYVAAVAAEGIENGDMLKDNPYADDVRAYVGSQ
eukprot:TRINITY_DN19465_c0_g1_i1.p1 TRINITY_DN19465_c0_g1~~TRINITY_DN19465_c0_g1_i1.p1  ORF type:complete len:331 (-),score=37.17 TRINITY_DN19465_c0_g1_i1:477-1469(-)